MELLNKLQDVLENLPPKRFYQYSGIFMLSIVLLTGILFYYTSSRINTSLKRLNTLNELREESRTILERAQRVQQQRTDVDEIIAQNPAFKIGGNFKALLQTLNLTDKRAGPSEIETQERDDKYRAVILTARLTQVSMRQITELIQALEKNVQIYIREIDIKRSVKKAADALDVLISIATLQQKTATTESLE